MLMLRLEILELLKEIKSLSDVYEKKKKEDSLRNFLLEKREEIENNFDSIASVLSEEDINYLKSLVEQKIEDNDDLNDIENIKNMYGMWLLDFKREGEVTSKCSQIIDSIIHFYARNRFEIIERLFKIDEGEDYERFKAHLKNKLRGYFAERIKVYLNSSNYQNLSWFARRRKNNEIRRLVLGLDSYNFDNKKFLEVLE